MPILILLLKAYNQITKMCSYKFFIDFSYLNLLTLEVSENLDLNSSKINNQTGSWKKNNGHFITNE